MPLRSSFLFSGSNRIIAPHRQWQLFSFHTSAARRQDSPNHYETLNVPPNATPADVKKSFYALSKAHHPDRNLNDPTASERFVRISEAYATLSIPAKRHAYDRDVLRVNQHQHQSSHRPHRGSYSSSGPVGGRPASGLSSRRTQFRGPPASFYRNGGWGSQSEKRAEAQRNGAPGAETPEFEESVGGRMGGMGPGQQPWGHGNDVPHFDKKGHFRTHEAIRTERRRHLRKSSGEERVESDEGRSGLMGQFLMVTAVVGFTVWVPGFLFERLSRTGREEEK